ncbi:MULTISPECIES: class II fructose-1,6-bisphosphate aldolase [Virgibacillus]|uniref:Class II fructose-1,6-bisphosphate aldolase n=1 Tax=Virgibacillus dokdonensis TaxID=302167 RepID=A0ABU7VGT1_9BACI|nr:MULTISPECIES: class II fructose-1,6-bisphosphate aldolase [Virgibacillus]NWO12580.1 class II fructose-1,6-bisphosphate aldolase [Virgibacillus sp.]
MALVTLNDILPQAKQAGYAVGHFNINGLIWPQAILEAAQEAKAPVIIASSDRLVDYLGGFKLISDMVRNLMEVQQITVPVVLHLDHGQSVERCFEAIDAGYSSVMYDGSHFPVAENIKNTKQVVDYAHVNGVSVEAEIGTVGGYEDGLIGNICYANLRECVELVEKTRVDALAAALGSVHGKYVGEPKLGFKQMAEISKEVEIPLVLHGASGIPLDQLQKSIRLGHAKININTEMNIAWREALQQSLVENPEVYEPKKLLELSKQAMKETVHEKIQEFGSSNKAMKKVE